MAKDMESKKRKASVPESGAEKVKKVKKVDVAPNTGKKRKASEDTDLSKVKKSKKATDAAPSTEKPAKKAAAIKAIDDSKPTKAAKKINKEIAAPVVEDEDSDEDESEVDDQTEALLKGFESGDEDSEDDGEGLKEGVDVPTAPLEKLTKGQKKALKRAAEIEKAGQPGTVYIGRIPHGFFEHQMKEYFGQFGTVLRVRLSRNKKTGASKHYGFIEFESSEVAEIVAKTMANYLMFGHILKIHVVPDAQLHESLWKGANSRFKMIPRNAIAGRKLKLPTTEEVWDDRSAKLEVKRAAKVEQMKTIGYEYEAPKLKSAKGLAKEHPDGPLIEAAETTTEAIEDTPAPVEPTKSKKGKSAKPAEVEAPVEDEPKPKKAAKAKKITKVEAVEEVIEEPAIAPTAEEPAKPKKTKRSKKVTETETIEVVPEAVAEPPTEEPSKAKKKEKKSKAAKAVEPAVEEVAAPEVEKAIKPEKKAKKAKKVEVAAAPVDEAVVEVAETKVKKPKKAKKVAA